MDIMITGITAPKLIDIPNPANINGINQHQPRLKNTGKHNAKQEPDKLGLSKNPVTPYLNGSVNIIE